MFTKKERKWIIVNYGDDPAVTVMRIFCKEFNVSQTRKKKLNARMFRRVRDNFIKEDDSGYSRSADVRQTNKERVNEHFQTNQTTSIRVT